MNVSEALIITCCIVELEKKKYDKVLAMLEELLTKSGYGLPYYYVDLEDLILMVQGMLK